MRRRVRVRGHLHECQVRRVRVRGHLHEGQVEMAREERRSLVYHLQG